MRNRITGRVRPVGLGVILFALLILVVPLRMFNSGGHPLAGVENVDLCALLERDALRVLPGAVLATSPEIPGFAERPPGTCWIRFAAPEGAPESPEVSVTLLTRRYLSQGSIRFKTGKYLETFLGEERASGNAVETASGPWRMGATIRRRGANGQLDLLAEDGGIVLWIRGKDLTSPSLLEFAAASARDIRHPSPKNP